MKAKFEQNDHLINKLLQTGESILIEGNTWGDKIWGVCNGVGENKLGKILMKVRNELKEASDGTE
ncbi:NADAR family protein [Bacillus sonorensis]|uniref:NADAR family protein n=1 Tax=Bacillus sonorensis TaxID=119858 RepID=UPI00227F04CC|nr:NADAR family protein [Bacillus sonorensis]